jgi:hypothetical protein
VDILSLVAETKSSKTPEKYSEDFQSELFSRLEDILSGDITMSHRDTRTYAQVAKTSISNV